MSDFRDNASQTPTIVDRSRLSSKKNEEWYDQGFDLGEDASSKEDLAAYGINPDLLKSTSEQLSEASRNQEQSDAEKLREGSSVELDMDPLADKNSFGGSTVRVNQGPRTGPIVIGGQGKIYNDSEMAAAKGSMPVYSDKYLDARQVGTQSSGAVGTSSPEEYDSEYGTLARGNRSVITAADERYIQQRKEEELAARSLSNASRTAVGGAELVKPRELSSSPALRKMQLQEMRRRQLKEQQERFQKARAERERQKQNILNLQREQRQQILNTQNDLTEATSSGSMRTTKSTMLANRVSGKQIPKDRRDSIWNDARMALEAIAQKQGNASPYKQQSKFSFVRSQQGIPAGVAVRGGHSRTELKGGYIPLFDQPSGSQAPTVSAEGFSSTEAYNKFQSTIKAAQEAPNDDIVPTKAPPGVPVDESTRSHASRMSEQRRNQRAGVKTNQEKSIEELAREYPGLSPEHLIKLKRSNNRCHLVSRTPIYDSSSNISMYELKFTAGKLFQVNSLKSEHVYHVLFGYFIRRGVSCFIGRRSNVLVMMPITYDLLDYLDRYSVSRMVLRICPEQPVTPSALHILTKLRRSGMSFAIDLMLLLKKDWNKAVLSIEYVMIDLSAKVPEQLQVFQRLKVKAPWLKTIGYNDVNTEGYGYLNRHQIDYLDAPFVNPQFKFNQDPAHFKPMQDEVLTLIHALFALNPNYSPFQSFLSRHDDLSRDMAVFLYRFRHASPRQVQNASDLYNYLLDSSASRSFAILAGRAIMLHYVKSMTISSQYILQENFSQALIRGYFIEYLNKVFNDPYLKRYGFAAGMFSLLHLFLLQEEVDVISNDEYSDIFDRIYESELLTDIIECINAIESTNLSGIFSFIQKYKIPPASVLISHEKAIMRTNEVLLVLNIVAGRQALLKTFLDKRSLRAQFIKNMVS